MLGAIVGDIIGSRHEFNPIKQTEFDLFHSDCRYTDDTVCTVAVADALLADAPIEPTLVEWVNEHMYAGFGLHFRSEERRVRKVCVHTFSSRLSPYHYKKKHKRST